MRPAADLRERVPGFGGGSVDQLDSGRGVFERIGCVGEAFEDQGVLVAVAGPALSRRRDDAGVGSLGHVEHRLRRGGGVVQAPAPYREVLPDGVDRRFVAVPSLEPPPVARMGHVPGDPDLPGAHGDMKFKQPPVGGDRPGRGCVQALIADEIDGGRIGEPGPQQAALAVVVTDDDGLARGDALFGERHDEGGELGVGAVEAGLVEVAHLAARRASPHHKAPVCPACGRTAPPAAALVAMNVCVMSIASARPLLLWRCPSASHRPVQVGLLSAASAWAYGFPAAFPATRLALPLAAWAVFPALSRLLTGITSFPGGPVTPGTRRTPVGFPGPQRLNQPANRVSESAQDLGCRVQRGRGEPGLPR